MPSDKRSRGQVRVEGMCGDIQRGTFPNLRLSRRRENRIDFKVLEPMERQRNQMKRTAGFVIRNRGMVVDQELTGQVLGKNSMDRAAMSVIRRSMVMIGLGMDMNQWRSEHP